MDRNSKEVEAAVAVLEGAGYYVGNLWHTDDVQSKYDCDELEAQDILADAVGGEWIMEQINIRIDDFAQKENYPEK